MKNISRIVLVLVVLAPLRAFKAWGAPLKVVATTPELASLVREVGGDLVSVESLSKPLQNPHFVDAKPSLIVKLMNADLFIETGMELEVGWAPLLIQTSGNKNVQPGSKGFLDASAAVPDPLEVPQNPDRSMGDVHPQGNPHYMMDPRNGERVAKLIADRLSELSPGNAAAFQARFESFKKRLDGRMADWEKAARESGLSGSKAVTYHRTWSYFAKRFGFEVAGYIEPKPGIPPSPKHMEAILGLMKSQKVKLIILEPYFDKKLPRKIAEETGARLAVLPTTVGAEKGIDSYTDLFDRQMGILTGLLKGGRP